MTSNKIKAGIIIILSLLLLSSCKGQQSSEPTMDPDMIYTSAAITVEAQLTQAALANPSATNTEMPTPEPSATPETQNQEGAQATTDPAQSGQPGQPVSTSTPVVLATFTASPRPPSAKAQFELLDQDPDDGSVVGPGVTFDMVWSVKNTGTETWTEMYTVEFFLGDRIGGGRYTEGRYYFKHEVKPGETINIMVDMKTPGTAGEYYSWWKLKDDQGNNFGDVDVTLIVKLPTATP